MENWKDIQGYEGHFQISDQGRIKSLKRQVPHKKRGTLLVDEKILKPSIKAEGYEIIHLKVKGISKGHNVHRLVAEAFIPRVLEKPHVNHMDGDKTNNKASNLEWVSCNENMEHALNNNLLTTKLTHSDIPIIRELLDKGLTCTEISRSYGVSRMTISYIKRNICWKNH